jgi:hypothetical protein
MKRPPPETFEQNVRLKKPCAANAPTRNGQIAQSFPQSRSIAHVAVETYPQFFHLSPPCSINIFETHGSNNARLDRLEDRSLLVLPPHSHYINRVIEERLLTNDTMESMDGEPTDGESTDGESMDGESMDGESMDRELSLADEKDAVPEVCFGVVSHSIS